jgi:hypothetical protein
MNTEEKWLYIAKLEAENRASKTKSEALKRKHQSKMNHMTNISHAITVAMSIFNPIILLSSQDEKNDKDAR